MVLVCGFVGSVNLFFIAFFERTRKHKFERTRKHKKLFNFQKKRGCWCFVAFSF